MLSYVALRVCLNQQIEISRLVVAGDGCIRANDFLLGTIGLGKQSADRDVLAYWETKNRVRSRELEPISDERNQYDSLWDI